MRVILLDDVANLGEAGSVLEVKNGYARNFLIPRHMAESATRDALNRLELIKRAAEAKRRRRMDEAAAKYAELARRTLTLVMRAGSENRLFGAVTSSLIADEVQKQFGIALDRRHVMLEDPIKHLGEYIVPLRASAEVTGEIRLTVEAEVKAGRGKAAAKSPSRGKPQAAQASAAPPAAAGSADVERAIEEAESHEKYEHVEQNLEP
jgi:large subunit ribosomal protein L9